LRVAVVRTMWNEAVVGELVKGIVRTLNENGVTEENIIHAQVAGAYELPFAAKSLILRNMGHLDAVICVGCLIKGKTMHFEYIAQAVTAGISSVGLDTGVPVIFGVLTCLNEDQARQRAGLPPESKKSSSHEAEEPHNHGIDWAFTAIQMARHKFQDPTDYVSLEYTLPIKSKL